MKSIVFTAALFSAGALAQSAASASATIDPSAFLAQISAFAGMNPSMAAPFEAATTINVFDIGAPPDSLVPMILTAVPASALGELMNPTGRASLASEFQAGNTPEWYQALPSEVKSYVEEMRGRVQAGNLVQTGADGIPSAFGGRGGSGATPGGAGAESTSEGLAAKPTGALGVDNGMFAMGVAGMVGIMGLAVGL